MVYARRREVGPMLQTDISITQFVNGASAQNSHVDAAMVAIAGWAIPVMVLAVALQWWSGTPRYRNRHILVAAGLSFVLALAVNQVILLFVHRPRPYELGLTHLLGSPSADPSFPSDHATASFAIAGAFLAHRVFGRASLFILAALVVSFSRVFIGTHYASDVFGGALIGLAAAFAVNLAYQPGTRFDRLVTEIL